MNKATLLQYEFCYWLSLKGFTNKKCRFRNCFEKSPNKNPIAWYLNNLQVFRCSFIFSKKWNNSKKLHIFCAISEMKRAIQDPLVAKRHKFCYSFRLWLFWKKLSACSRCDYACSDPSALKTHLKMHSEQSPANATNTTFNPLGQTIWGFIWKHIEEKSQTNATNVIMHALTQVLWGHI